MTNTKTLFVAFSHQLTSEQVEDARASLNIETIVSLRDVNADLQAKFSAVPASASAEDIQLLASKIVKEARAVNADYFFCTGEPTLMMWSNIYADGSLIPNGEKGITCITSTTERCSEEQEQPDGTIRKVAIFKHVQWRGVFESLTIKKQ